MVQLRADALTAKLDEPGRVQGRVPHDSVQIDIANPTLPRQAPRETMINAYAGCERPRGWSFLAHHWELITVSLEGPYLIATMAVA